MKSPRLLMILLAATLLSGCGATIKNRATGEEGSWNGASTAPQAGAECNSFSSSSNTLSGKVTTYYYNGVLQEDRVRLRFTSLSSQFDNSSNVHIKLFRWYANPDGSTYLDSNPLNMIVERGENGSFPISGTLSSMNILDIAKIRESGKVPGTTTQSFFDETVLVVSGLDYQWHALKVVLYDGTKVIGQADLLLPVFAANPNTYALTHPTVLNQLHPFWAQRTQAGMKDKDWVNRSMSFCF